MFAVSSTCRFESSGLPFASNVIGSVTCNDLPTPSPSASKPDAVSANVTPSNTNDAVDRAEADFTTNNSSIPVGITRYTKSLPGNTSRYRTPSPSGSTTGATPDAPAATKRTSPSGPDIDTPAPGPIGWNFTCHELPAFVSTPSAPTTTRLSIFTHKPDASRKCNGTDDTCTVSVPSGFSNVFEN